MIRFDSDINNPIQEAIDIINNIKYVKNFHQADYFKYQCKVVLQERIINNKTLDEVGLMLNVTRERIRQIEIRLKEILITKMKGQYDQKS